MSTLYPGMCRRLKYASKKDVILKAKQFILLEPIFPFVQSRPVPFISVGFGVKRETF